MRARLPWERLGAAALLLIPLTACGWLRSEAAAERGPADVIPPAESRAALDPIRADARLDALCARAAGVAVNRFAALGLGHDDVAVAVVDLSNPERPRLGEHRGSVAQDPAQLAALPLTAFAHRQRLEGRFTDHLVLPLIQRMLGEGDDNAFNEAVDLLAGTQTGMTLIGPVLDDFIAGRRSFNAWLQSLGLYGLRLGHLIPEGEPSGRERQLAEPLGAPTNLMTAADTARLLFLIETGQLVTRRRSLQIANTAARAPGRDPLAARLPEIPENSRIWGMAGWQGRANHGAWVVRMPGGRCFAIVALTQVDGDHPEIPRAILQDILSRL